MPAALVQGVMDALPVKIFGVIAAMSGAIPLIAQVFIKIVQEGECGVYMRGGKVRVLKDGQVKLALPGTHRIFPLWRSIMMVSVKDQPADLAKQTIHLNDNTQVNVDTAIVYRREVDGVAMRKSLLGVDNIQQAIVNLVSASVMTIVVTQEWTEGALADDIGERIVKDCGAELRLRYGIILACVQVTGFGKTEAQMRFDGMREVADAIRYSDSGQPLGRLVVAATED